MTGKFRRYSAISIFALVVSPCLAQQATVPELPETIVEAEAPNRTPVEDAVGETPSESPPMVGLPIAPRLSDTSDASTSASAIESSEQITDSQTSNLANVSPRPQPGANPIIGRAENLLGETTSASTGRFGQAELDFRPINRPGDVLELIPGFIATQHSGTGKANQYFVRGINLDHGTDFALRVDGVPMNLPSHGHGQGYLDVNWLIPELIESVDFRLGPYSADVGDFSSAGSADIHLLRELPDGIATATAGSYDYYRALIADSRELAGGTLLYGFETSFYDGPWVVSEDFEKLNGVLRWSFGDKQEGFSLTAMGYQSDWTATNQISQRAVTAGLVDRFGSLDPTDAGDTSRYGLNAEYWSNDADVSTRANAYISYYDLDLFSNFTFFLDDSINGDQIQQLDNRWYGGVNASRTYHRQDVDHTFGFQFRNDNIYNLALNRTRQQQLVSQVRNDSVDQQSYSLYYVNEASLTDWARSSVGLRGDLYRFHNRSDLDPADTNTTDAGIFSPKLGLALGPWADSELFLNWGQSFHSNDSRGVNSSTDPANPLVKSDGSEIGMRSYLTPKWNSTLVL